MFEFTFELIEVDALPTTVFVFAFTAAVPALIFAARFAAREDEAEVTSDCTAREPEERPAPVRVRVPNDQTWEAVRPEETLVAN